MRFHFLEAADGTQLAKQFALHNGQLETVAYPMVKYFNSYEEHCATPAELYTAITTRAAQGHALLKGQLVAPLVNEPRAGMTSSTATTQWLALDIDIYDGLESIDELLAAIDPALADVSYVFQHSASAGIQGQAGIRGHVYIMLNRMIPAPKLKDWLIAQNLAIPALKAKAELAKNGVAMKWALDITTCQNDKLIYIAPPICNGVKDPLAGQRTVFIQKANDLYGGSFAASPAQIKADTEQLVNDLRKAAGLKPKKGNYKKINGEQILLNPDRATVTSERQGRGFTYVNLDGGDSWAYYFPTNNPEYLYNFKGEPTVRLKDLDPDYYFSVSGQTTGTPAKEEGEQLIAFRDFETDTYYNGTYNPAKQQLNLAKVGSTQKIAHFFAQYGTAAPEFLEDWTYEFNPTKSTVLDAGKRWANKFSPTKYLLDTEATEAITIPPLINRVITSICVDEPTKAHFLNWLAYIFQYRDKTQTAWIFHGTTGTGKGLLFDKVLRPIFGEPYVQPLILQTLEDQFNGQFETMLIGWVDEMHLETYSSARRVMDKVKNLITEKTMPIRKMRAETKATRVFNNMVFATNNRDMILLAKNDRRFNVAPRQEMQLQITPSEVDAIEAELSAFASFLRHYTVDTALVKTPIYNDARQELLEISTTDTQSCFDAWATGNLDYFLEYINENPPVSPINPYIPFERAVKRWAANCHHPAVVLTRDEMADVYEYLTGQKLTPAKFSKLCRIHRVDITPQRINDRIVRGHKVKFKNTDRALLDYLLNRPNVVKIS